MRLPALWILAAFAAGVAASGWQPVNSAVWLSGASAGLLAGFLSLRRNRPALALSFALAAWFGLGGLAAVLESGAVPAQHVTRLLAENRIETIEPLRWRGRLRSDPMRMPWGHRVEFDLEEVVVAGNPVSTSGGLRLTYMNDENRREVFPTLRAGERVEALVRARPPRNYLNPGAFDARAHLARQGVHLVATLRSTELLTRLESPPPTLRERFARLRGFLLTRVEEMFGDAPEQAAVLRAMLLGDRSFVEHDLIESFQRTAAYHVLVISGLHVAALVVFVLWCGRRLRLTRGAAIAVTLAVLLLFVGIVEDRPPILRASLMAAVVLAAAVLYRRVDLLNTVSVAGLLLLLAKPSTLADPSFQLTFLAVGIIGALGLPWVEATSAPYRAALHNLSDVNHDAAHPPRAAQFRLDLRAAAGWISARMPARFSSRATGLVTGPLRLTFRVWELFLISAAIQIGMLPLLAHYFHRVSPSGPLANIPAAVLAGLIVPFGFLALGASLLWSWLSAAPVWLTAAMVDLLLGSVKWFDAWAAAAYRIPGPPALAMTSFFVAAALLAVALRARWRRGWCWLAGAPLVAGALVVATFPFAPRLEAGKLEVTVLDVGQGDSIFTAFPDGRVMLIDGGGAFGRTSGVGYRAGFDVGEQVVSPYLWHRGVKRIDAAVLTHAHLDHIDGLHAVLKNFRVDELWVGRDVAIPAYEALLQTAAERGTSVARRRRGEFFTWDGATGLVLWPEETSAAERASNDDSLVLRLEYGRSAFLLPGDIERRAERELVTRGDPLAADFLKVPHHGSRTSTTAEFAAAVAPRLAAISVAEGNPYGHPHAEVGARLGATRAHILRTDQHGAITLVSDGTGIRARAFAQPAQMNPASVAEPATSGPDGTETTPPAPGTRSTRARSKRSPNR